MKKRQSILLTKCEVQSNYDRQDSAEGLITQLPNNHDGRNTWLMNYGKGDEAVAMRKARDLIYQPNLRAAESRNQQIRRQHSA